MRFKSTIIKPIAKNTASTIRKWSANAVKHQESIFKKLIKVGATTSFGKDHHFDKIHSYNDFKQAVPIRTYEKLRPYIQRIIEGESNVLWKGRPIYFAKTSGTTSGVKYIPLTRESMPNHFGTARDALFNYSYETGNPYFIDGKMIFLSGSPELTKTGNINTGRLSGIVNHRVPAWLRKNQLPSIATNSIEDWETKVGKIVDETYDKDMRLISGIPPWVQMYYEKLLEKTGKEYIKDIFPNFSVFVYGGVNFEPYRQKLEALVGKKMDSVETYPASEGFIAFQDSQTEPGLLLNSKSGIFFEFILADEFHNEHPTRINLVDVEVGVNYVIIINSNAGLWGYNIGDTVEFLSTNPHRLIVTGRIKHFISAFGEHVIAKEVENALITVANQENISIVEFTVAPQINPSDDSLPYHEWFVEFDKMPDNLTAFSQKVDDLMIQQNIYYEDLIVGKILQPLKIRPLQRNAFREYMKTIGKLGGQNKVPRLSNDRKIAAVLETFVL